MGDAWELVVHDSAASSERKPLTLALTADDTIKKVIDVISEKWELQPADFRVWDYYSKSRYAMLDQPDKTLRGAKLYAGQDLLVVHKNQDGTWPPSEASNGSG